MSWLRSCRNGWRAICLVAITYVYFLIFAQFAFLHRLADLHLTQIHLKAVMAAMATGGILLSLLAPRSQTIAPQRRMQAAFAVCGLAALLTLAPLALASALLVSFLLGAGLGLLTVTLVTHLRLWLSLENPLLQVGLGTGIGYVLSNIPALFTASPQTQALTAAALCLLGLLLVLQPALHPATPLTGDPPPAQTLPPRQIPFPFVLAAFTALIWLDSAAFFIIQSTPSLKAGTWQGTLHLWVNAALHLAAALACVWLLRRRSLTTTLALAFAALAFACLLLLDPHRALLASVFYPVGVSLYSVALVAYPSLLAPAASLAVRGRRAGSIYAIAGWCGSAMGIGMAQNLGHVPPAFVLCAGVVVMLPLLLHLFRRHPRELAVTAAVLLAALTLDRAIHPAHSTAQSPAASPVLSAAERGRQVYIAEGCIHCHSQYVRPHTADVLLWGPLQPLSQIRREQPPLIGNRRQGPDLSQVGNRRSPLWLRAHFYDPASLNPPSFMPSYRHLFDQNGNARGDDLIAFLASLNTGDTAQHLRDEQAWSPAASAVLHAAPATGAALFQTYCITCHTATGATRTRWQTGFHRLPPNLLTDPLQHVSREAPLSERRTQLARIVKFGLPGTDMAGHEVLSDTDVASLALWLANTVVTPPSTASAKHPVHPFSTKGTTP